jgi:hypothetical protein
MCVNVVGTFSEDAYVPKVTRMAQVMAAWVECPDRLMVRYEMGMSPTPQAAANIRIPMKGTLLGYNLKTKVSAISHLKCQ